MQVYHKSLTQKGLGQNLVACRYAFYARLCRRTQFEVLAWTGVAQTKYDAHTCSYIAAEGRFFGSRPRKGWLNCDYHDDQCTVGLCAAERPARGVCCFPVAGDGGGLSPRQVAAIA